MKYVALLRGINVGGNNKIEMAKLKVSFEAHGFTDVRTYINSGNIIFESSQKEVSSISTQIENFIKGDFKINIKVLVKKGSEVVKLSKSLPAQWKNDSEQKTDILFLWDEFCHKSSLGLIAANPKVDRLIYQNGTIVWNLSKKDYGKSGMNKFIGTELHKNMTARNINTVRKLAELLQK